MERLTEENPNWINDELWEGACQPDCEETDRVYRRLKEYEDTGLTPEQMWQIDGQFREQARELGEYKRAEEQGILLRMPCKVGDTVYVLVEMDDDGKYTRVKVDFIDDIYFEDNVIMIRFQYVWHDTTLSDIGKTVFLTREEAEAKLVEMEGSHD